jgi:hypothetical protein
MSTLVSFDFVKHIIQFDSIHVINGEKMFITQLKYKYKNLQEGNHIIGLVALLTSSHHLNHF